MDHLFSLAVMETFCKNIASTFQRICLLKPELRFYHEIILPTGIPCKKILCHMGDSDCGWFIAENIAGNAKMF